MRERGELGERFGGGGVRDDAWGGFREDVLRDCVAQDAAGVGFGEGGVVRDLGEGGG